MGHSILDMSTHKHVSISDKNVEKLINTLKDFLTTGYTEGLGAIAENKDFFSDGYTEGLGAIAENKDVFSASVNCDKFRVWLTKGKVLQISAEPFDCEEYNFVFRHNDKLGRMELGDIFGDMGTKKIDNERKCTALVHNVLAPALANLGF
ncbi:MAG: hypothetical protein UDQ58_06705 [Desulfovibrio sp.]|nr:hypothetical protein [Desulfovibrio sp.]